MSTGGYQGTANLQQSDQQEELKRKGFVKADSLDAQLDLDNDGIDDTNLIEADEGIEDKEKDDFGPIEVNPNSPYADDTNNILTDDDQETNIL